MIQFNLLPDVKLNYVKTKRLKHTIILISIIVSGVSLAILILLFTLVDVVQKNNLASLNTKINNGVSTVQATPHLNDILTLQSQLEQINTLHKNEVVANRLIGIVGQITPVNANINQVSVSFVATTGSKSIPNQITLTGTAPDLQTLSEFVDIMKLCTYQTSTNSTPKLAFTDVTTGNISYSPTGTTSVSITATFDPILFAQPTTTNITFNIPSDSITHSTAVESQDLFALPPPTNNQGH